MNAKAIVLGDTTIMEKLFSHQTCLHFVRKRCYSLSTIFPHLWTAAAQKKNLIFRILIFMIPLHKRAVKLWIKLFKSATEITCIRFPKKNKPKTGRYESDKLNIEMQGLRLRIKIFSTFTTYSILQPVYLSLQPPVLQLICNKT